jgi:hypothetical protein
MNAKRRWLLSVASLPFLILLLVTACRREAPAPAADARKFIPETKVTTDARAHAISEELAALGEHPWAGEYRCGDGLGVNRRLLLAPNSGFLYTWHGCLGMYDMNYGPASPTKDGSVALYCEFQNNEWGARGLPERLHPVRWGERRYLLADDEIAEFRNWVKHGFQSREPQHRSVRFLLRVGDEAKPAEGEPVFPPQVAAG